MRLTKQAGEAWEAMRGFFYLDRWNHLIGDLPDEGGLEISFSTEKARMERYAGPREGILRAGGRIYVSFQEDA